MLMLIVRRLLFAVPLLLAVTMVTFVLTSLAPGSAASVLLGSAATPERIAEAEAQLGLDRPLYEQYLSWLVKALSGDLGTSLLSSHDVAGQLALRIPVSLSLVTFGTLLAAILGITLGMVSALRGGALGRAVDAIGMIGFATPIFWLGLVLVSIFAVALHVLPATGYVSPAESVSGWLSSLTLPVVTLAVIGLAGIAKQTRDSMREVMSRDFIASLRAAGIPEWRVVLGSGLRNAAIPIVTLIGVLFVSMLGATALVESVFVLPGLGSLAVTSATSGDLPMLQGIVSVYCLVVIAVNLLVDVVYGLLNPRARIA